MYGYKLWSKNYLYDHFIQRLHIHQTCHFTQVLIFHCPVSITITFFSKFIILFAAAGISGKAISPFFFRLASNAFPDIGSVARIEKKKTKNNYHKKSRLYLRPYLKASSVFNVLQTCRVYLLAIDLGILKFIKKIIERFFEKREICRHGPNYVQKLYRKPRFQSLSFS